ncbi:MAG: WHG domain-containing protein [Burkholderiales bacterium]|nr:WHG domain-containing protein [Anaerolineae bacterium]
MAAHKQVNLGRVVEVAVTLADQRGFEAVTLAEVAGALGIRVPSLYNHISGLAGLRSEMALWGSRKLLEETRTAAVGKSGRAAIMSISDAYRAFAQAHPGVYPSLLRAPTKEEPAHTEIAVIWVDLLARVLAHYNQSEEDTLHTIRAWRSVMHGFISLEVAGGFGMPLDRDESFRRLIALFVDGLEAGQK